MKRRDFLHGATLAGAAGMLPLSAALAHRLDAATSAPRFVLARATEAGAGARFGAIDAACGDCALSTLRVRLDGMHVAEGGAVLREFWLSALFDRPDGAPAPFLAWHHADGRPRRGSQRLSFVAGRASMRGFELEYRVGDEAQCRREACALTTFAMPLLAPGHYVLAGPRRSGARIDPQALVHNGDKNAPLATQGRDFDYLAFRIEALA